MTATEPTRSPETTAPLDAALAQTQDVQARLNSGAQELFVIKEVLKQELPADARTGDVAQALEKHDALEEAVQECADDLEDVSQALAQEVARREKLEKKLTETRADLADIEAEMAAHQPKTSGN
ncbi:hypothetical protein ACSFA8_12920 [Variovorax sp. RT4R15]|uniref:hypothetical protein n=1 Tax=Variovorax sp. RT4R15 TaxID=3443737 RepID=UPI003F452655